MRSEYQFLLCCACFAISALHYQKTHEQYTSGFVQAIGGLAGFASLGVAIAGVFVFGLLWGVAGFVIGPVIYVFLIPRAFKVGNPSLLILWAAWVGVASGAIAFSNP